MKLRMLVLTICGTVLSTNVLAWQAPVSGVWELLRGYNVASHTCHSHTFNLSGSSPACDIYGLDFVPDKSGRVGGIVTSVDKGTVIFAGSQPSYGTSIIIEHGFGIYSRYSHLSYISVKKGDKISSGGAIGKSGKTGSGVGSIPHLHFAMYIKKGAETNAFKPASLGNIKNWPSKDFALNSTAPKLRSRSGNFQCVLNCSGVK